MHLQLVAIAADKKSSFAFCAPAEERQVTYVGPEPIPLKQGLLQRQKQGLIRLGGGTTTLTDQMMMVPFIHEMVAHTPLAHVSLRYQAQALQQLQVAIDSGDIYIGILGMNLGVDILGADMVIAALKCGDNKLALRG